MTLLPSPPANWSRPAIPVGTQLALIKAFLARMGIKINIDHRPPLSERPFDTATNNTIPPANDMGCLEVLTVKDHDQKTNGLKPGDKRITTAGSDANNRAKARKRLEHQQFMAQAKQTSDALERWADMNRRKSRFPQGRKIQSRPFQRRGR